MSRSTQQPFVSVVMSVFNGALYLEEAVESILRQTFPNFEFIVINDGSSDQTAEILNGYALRDSRLRVVHQSNHGLVEGLNRGCGLAAGQLIARMDADDVALPERLGEQVEFMNSHPEVGVLGTAVEVITRTGKVLARHTNPIEDRDIQEALLHQCPFWHPTVVMRRSVFLETGGYRKSVLDAEDHDLWLRIAERCKLANTSKVLLKYRLHANQVTARKCRQMTMSSLAARRAAILRREGGHDPLETAGHVNVEMLKSLGISDGDLERELSGHYLYSIRNLKMTGEEDLALSAIEEMLGSACWGRTSRRAVADLQLMAASLHWKRGQVPRSLSYLVRAIVTRPLVLARPLKHLGRKPGATGVHGVNAGEGEARLDLA